MGMDECQGVRVPYETLLEVIVSQRQLRGVGNHLSCDTARPRGMEAGGAVQHRTRVNPRKADLTWVSLPSKATPGIQSRQSGSGGGRGMKMLIPYPMRSPWPRASGRTGGDVGPMTSEKSDHLVVATKPGNAGGAKGMMG